ncbi:UDP-N-acetylmuramoyl-L-alanyl-D-glutamate--2,6-diaminopimelate ligase [Aliiglaciecola sp. 2_MG-2023]|uniref:UDP-N-acetylmuramoyl-L-alanyl-D-glutamate--2, 6-diaminopimelate ligase n=1 Tax=unclassified Aliiglaciecola TaxID=2593648 RepID=UPI0026E4704A|nr:MULTISPECIES: UDP-N-acetylmuramoyl-L-alanyl-D-glutamate--2,6-diaminopimelate ligase [unclassified Aliiglaciecola]MDO6711411.1 UDP-N-acetylmuramoyl-L-alanyl-D-glutamate--2,6-diaminopimelate ligase [Aliiglaciecola sp. 2_MG-2023]MDO6752612.1 UDP-N-acetylmuramoyl-L-alanyl-D-glutamate--2,6-diaminopimelate ligase [Aliiglaciecola sp. 1_MG-2023]
MQQFQAINNIKAVLAKFQIDAPDVQVSELVLDSREVAVHSVFVAIKGHQLDGRDFIPQAISLGAKLILQEVEQPQLHGEIEMREQSILISFYQLGQKLSLLAAAFYGSPAQYLDVIGVTGTNGKTSVVQLISQLRFLCGDVSASIGTLGAGLYSVDNYQLEKTLNTTPDACQVQKSLAKYVGLGAKQVALEASSHALVQDRIQGLKMDVAVFTNLTRDHLDYHGDMTEYAKAKRQLLNQPELKNLVLNADDPETANWISAASKQQKITLFSTQLSAENVADTQQYCFASNIQYDQRGLSFQLNSSWGNADIHCGLLGKFNVANLLAAIASLLVLGLSLPKLAKLCKKLKPVAGRMELFEHPKAGNLIVDFAHTPDALEQALKSARVHSQKQLICVFGCGGDRDKGKRPLMAAAAEQYSDQIIITSDNSRSEPSSSIFADILAGITDQSKVKVETDRKKAIQLAIAQSQKGDLIVVAGKGHETAQVIGQQSLPYDERNYVNTLCVGEM